MCFNSFKSFKKESFYLFCISLSLQVQMCNVKKKGSTLRNGVCFESVKMKEMDDMLIFL